MDVSRIMSVSVMLSLSGKLVQTDVLLKTKTVKYRLSLLKSVVVHAYTFNTIMVIKVIIVSKDSKTRI